MIMKIYSNSREYQFPLDKYVGKDVWIRVNNILWVKIINKYNKRGTYCYTLNILNEWDIGVGVWNNYAEFIEDVEGNTMEWVCNELNPGDSVEVLSTEELYELDQKMLHR